MKRQKSVPEDLTKVEADRSSPTELDFCRTFEEEVCPVLPQFLLVLLSAQLKTGLLILVLMFCIFSYL